MTESRDETQPKISHALIHLCEIALIAYAYFDVGFSTSRKIRFYISTCQLILPPTAPTGSTTNRKQTFELRSVSLFATRAISGIWSSMTPSPENKSKKLAPLRSGVKVPPGGKKLQSVTSFAFRRLFFRFFFNFVDKSRIGLSKPKQRN